LTDELLPRVGLDGRIALVTGSSRGLGAATAKRLAAMGAEVVVTWRTEEAAAGEVVAAITEAGGSARAHALDLGEIESIDALFDWIASDEGPGGLDVLVANAAATSLKPLLEQQPHNVERTFAISVTGFLRSVQRSVPLMEARGGGRIVAVSGIDTVSWAPAHGLLAAAKAAMEAMVRYLTIELGERNITTIGVNPDAFFGDGLQLMLGDYYDVLTGMLRRIHPLRQPATPEDIAEVVALLCTDAARWLSGNTVMADGAASFSGRGQVIGLTAQLPIEIQRQLAGLDPTDDPSSLEGGPSVPDL
jgi:NAD(P)-dependent dehydrogenase (short-subunit alcohol dehydrogenase family)